LKFLIKIYLIKINKKKGMKWNEKNRKEKYINYIKDIKENFYINKPAFSSFFFFI